MFPLLFYWRAAAACTDTVVLALICMCKCQWQGRCGDPGFRSRPVAQTISWGLCHGSFSLTSILDSGCTTQKLFRNNLDFCPDNSNKKKWCTKPLQTIFQLLIKMGQESSSSKQLLTVPIGGVCHWQIGKCLGACMVGRKHSCWKQSDCPTFEELQAPVSLLGKPQHSLWHHCKAATAEGAALKGLSLLMDVGHEQQRRDSRFLPVL